MAARAGVKNLISGTFCNVSENCHRTADERIGEPPSRCKQEPLVVKDEDERPQEDLLVCTASVCVAVVHC